MCLVTLRVTASKHLRGGGEWGVFLSVLRRPSPVRVRGVLQCACHCWCAPVRELFGLVCVWLCFGTDGCLASSCSSVKVLLWKLAHFALREHGRVFLCWLSCADGCCQLTFWFGVKMLLKIMVFFSPLAVHRGSENMNKQKTVRADTGGERTIRGVRRPHVQHFG